MSKISDAFALSQRLSIAAGEECARLGNPEIDVEHLFLALLVTDGSAGRVLRGLGITVVSGRAAVAQVHAERLAVLGISSPSLPAARTDPALVGELRWSPRGLAVMRSVPDYSDDLSFLTALVEEPGGFVRDVLGALGFDSRQVRDAIAAGPSTGGERTPPHDLSTEQGWRSVSHQAFAPAPVDAVWDLVSTPDRRLEWDSLQVASAHPRGDELVDLEGTTTRADGRRLRVRADRVRMQQRLLASEPQRHIEWEISWPDRGPGAPVQRFAVWLEPVGGGTQLRLRSRWRRRTGMSGLLRSPLLPLLRFAFKQQLVARAAGISRAVG